MLDVSAIDGSVALCLRSIVNTLRLSHTTPGVVAVVPRLGSSYILDFFDGRFPTDAEASQRIATLRYESGAYALRSSRIHNNKFKSRSGGYHERVTKSVTKMHKLLQEYVTPLTMREIVNMTDDVEHQYSVWVERPSSQISDVCSGLHGTTRQNVLEEAAHLKALGVDVKTRFFKSIIDEALPLYEEHKRRVRMKMNSLHVYIEPSGKVAVTKVESPQVANSTYYDSLDDAPENIRQQIFLLKLVDKNQYVPEVGQCMAEGIYWIHVAS
jgi:hypothetical protein